jgi:putative tryptophan/tyrosine transport system substrate-binding protein
MRRRDLLAGIGATAASPLVAHAAQQARIPVIGFLDLNSLEASRGGVADFRSGLREAGYVEGQNVAIEYRWGNNQPSILRQLADDLVRLQVAVIVASGAVGAALAAKAATSTIPIVLSGGADPVRWGLVASLNRPGGNVTGMTFILNQLAGKRLDLLLQLVPEARTIAYLVPPLGLEGARDTSELLAAARILDREIMVLECRAASDFESAFAIMAERQNVALMVSAFSTANSNRNIILALAARQKIPAIYAQSQYVRDGGLMSYAGRPAYRQVAIQYVARILKGDKPADLPVQQPTYFELIINLKSAKALGLEVPPRLLAIADKIIE